MNKQVWYLHTMECYSALKKKKILILSITCMNPENTISEIRSDRKTNVIILLICRIFSFNYTNELIHKTETDSQNEFRERPSILVSREGRIDWEFGIDMYTLI